MSLNNVVVKRGRPPGKSSFAPKLGNPLTEREWQVMRLICEGVPNKNIGAALGIGYHSAMGHKETLYIKWGVHSAVECLRHALQNGYYELSPQHIKNEVRSQ